VRAKIHGVPTRVYLCPPNPYHQKFEQKALFSSRLAGVNAQTPRHVKMKILADIIKHACNRFSIDPKDLVDDPDSNELSKSSSRAPAEGGAKIGIGLPWTLQKDAITAKIIS